MSTPHLSALYGELKLRQRRLGTPSEAPEDFERILVLAHQINNALTIELLRGATQPHTQATSLTEIGRRLFNPS